MIDAALAAFSEIFSPPFRKVAYKTLALTLGLLAITFAIVERVLVHFIDLPYPWVNTTLSILAGLGLFIALAYLVAPVSFAVGGFFFDELADGVERDISPEGPHGRAMPFVAALWLALKFALVALIVNILALLLLLVPGINAIAFFGANAYLFGRGYFELSALRFLPLEQVRALRQRYALRLFIAGLFVAAFLLVPILNLLTPLFATAFMIRITRPILAESAPPLQMAR